MDRSIPPFAHVPSTERMDSLSTASSLSTVKVLIEIVIPDHELKFIFRVPTNTLVREFLRRVLTVCHLDTNHYVNYGFYCPAHGVKKGKYLQEERLLEEYPELCDRRPDVGNGTTVCSELMSLQPESEPNTTTRPTLWLIRKCRYVNGLPMASQKFKHVNSKHHQKQLMSAIRNHDLNKMETLLAEGLDPNFQFYKTNDTPLNLAAVQTSPKELILKLVEHGAHLDYRDYTGQTALHWAAISGNADGIRTLLDLGLSPNVRDSKDLTPLYRAVSRDVPTLCINMLLYDHAILGVMDDKNKQEIHQACLFNNPNHLEQLIIYGADLDAQTCNLDTPLHICAWSNHVKCLRMLLRAGAKRDLENASGQTPYQVALLTELPELAEEIDAFTDDQVVPITTPPMYNTSRKATVCGPRGALEATRASSTNLFSSVSSERGSGTSNSIPAQSSLLRYNHTSLSSLTSPTGSGHKTPPYFRGLSSPGNLSYRMVTLNRGDSGFGFQLRGQKDPIQRLNEDIRPANQYFDEVFPDTPASAAGLLPGDYLVEVNGFDVRNASHHQVADKIVRSGNSVTLKVLTRGTSIDSQTPVNLRISDRRTPIKRRQTYVEIQNHVSRTDRPLSHAGPTENGGTCIQIVRDELSDSNSVEVVVEREIVVRRRSSSSNLEQFQLNRNIQAQQPETPVSKGTSNKIVIERDLESYDSVDVVTSQGESPPRDSPQSPLYRTVSIPGRS